MSSVLASLLDLPDTISDIMQWDHGFGHQSILKLAPGEMRARHFRFYSWQDKHWATEYPGTIQECITRRAVMKPIVRRVMNMSHPIPLIGFNIAFLFVTIGFSDSAFAYLDAGTGSLLLQLLIAGVMVTLFTVKLYWYRFKGFFARLRGKETPATETEVKQTSRQDPPDNE